MEKSKAPYLYVLFAALLISLLIFIIPFTEKKEPPGRQSVSEEGVESKTNALDLSAYNILIRAEGAYGGSKTISSLKAIQMNTTSLLKSEGGETATEKAYYRFPNRMRSEAHIGAETYIQAYDNGMAWVMENGVVSDGDLRTREILRKSLKHFPNFLIQATDSASLAMIKGKSFIEGKPHYMIYVIDPDSDEFTLWIAMEDFLVKRIDYPVYAGTTEEHMRLDFLSFREKKGLKLPYKVNIFLNGILVQETTVLDYEINPSLPDSLFEKPGTAG
ncbi:MAG: hypothetical protein ACE5OP_01210 [Candidatus Glassbacteria bacterium]